jgi:hypothetical protein
VKSSVIETLVFIPESSLNEFALRKARVAAFLESQKIALQKGHKEHQGVPWVYQVFI